MKYNILLYSIPRAILLTWINFNPSMDKQADAQ